MKVLFAFLVAAVLTKLQLNHPEELRAMIKDSEGNIGSMDYSVSTFGHILYANIAGVDVLQAPENEYGCDALTAPSRDNNKKFVWLFQRGTCTFAAKAFNSQQSGAYAVVVYHDRENMNVKNIIPSGDSFYNHLKIPIILISHEDGLKLKNALGQNKQVDMTIDLELVN